MISLSLVLPPVLLSLLAIAKFWKVDKEPIIDPPIHEEYRLCQSKLICNSSPYRLSSLCTLSSNPVSIDDPPQKIAFFMISCLRSSVHFYKLVSIISVKLLFPSISLNKISLGPYTSSFDNSIIEPSGS